MTLGFSIGDVGACSFIIWLCLEWFQTYNAQTEVIMNTLLKTVVNTLTVLWGQVVGEHVIDMKVCEN